MKKSFLRSSLKFPGQILTCRQELEILELDIGGRMFAAGQF